MIVPINQELDERSRSFAGAWIEIDFIFSAVRLILVAPSRERGLKFPDCSRGIRNICRSFAGAWIEISFLIMVQLW